jgi:hypothetical protein
VTYYGGAGRRKDARRRTITPHVVANTVHARRTVSIGGGNTAVKTCSVYEDRKLSFYAPSLRSSSDACEDSGASSTRREPPAESHYSNRNSPKRQTQTIFNLAKKLRRISSSRKRSSSRGRHSITLHLVLPERSLHKHIGASGKGRPTDQ